MQFHFMRLPKWWLHSLPGLPNWQWHVQYEVQEASSARFAVAVHRICTLCLRRFLCEVSCCCQEELPFHFDHVAFLNNNSLGPASLSYHISQMPWNELTTLNVPLKTLFQNRSAWCWLLTKNRLREEQPVSLAPLCLPRIIVLFSSIQLNKLLEAEPRLS